MNAPLNLLAELKRVRCITDLVLAISAMHLSNKSGRYTRIATEYYVSALGSLRSMVDGGEVEGSEDWLMLMVTLLCLYEVCPNNRTSPMIFPGLIPPPPLRANS